MGGTHSFSNAMQNNILLFLYEKSACIRNRTKLNKSLGAVYAASPQEHKINNLRNLKVEWNERINKRK